MTKSFPQDTRQHWHLLKGLHHAADYCMLSYSITYAPFAEEAMPGFTIEIHDDSGNPPRWTGLLGDIVPQAMQWLLHYNQDVHQGELE